MICRNKEVCFLSPGQGNEILLEWSYTVSLSEWFKWYLVCLVKRARAERGWEGLGLVLGSLCKFQQKHTNVYVWKFRSVTCWSKYLFAYISKNPIVVVFENKVHLACFHVSSVREEKIQDGSSCIACALVTWCITKRARLEKTRGLCCLVFSMWLIADTEEKSLSNGVHVWFSHSGMPFFQPVCGLEGCFLDELLCKVVFILLVT